MQFAIGHHQTRGLVDEVFRKLPANERDRVERRISAITDSDLVTAIRPFMFGGKVVHELYFDPSKLSRFRGGSKTGAVVAAFAIASLAGQARGSVRLSDEALRKNPERIIQLAKRWGFGNEVTNFISTERKFYGQWCREDTQRSIKHTQESIRIVKKTLRTEKNLDRKLVDVHSSLMTHLDVLASATKLDLELCGDAERNEKNKLQFVLSQIQELKTTLASKKS